MTINRGSDMVMLCLEQLHKKSHVKTEHSKHNEGVASLKAAMF